MILSTLNIKSVSQLEKHLRTHIPTLYVSSQTSTVIPLGRLKSYYEEHFPEYPSLTVAHLSGIPGELELLPDDTLRVSGSVTWKEARSFLNEKGRDLCFWPTEELACILAGVATSATGERSFSFGNMRSVLLSCTYLDYQGSSHKLASMVPLSLPGLKEYHQDWPNYKNFKNAPYPRFEQESDLMIGTEGQLGVLTEAQLKTIPLQALSYFILELPHWNTSMDSELVLNWVQKYRGSLYTCELLDAQSLALLSQKSLFKVDCDYLLFEMPTQSCEQLLEEWTSELSALLGDPRIEERFFELSDSQFHSLRAEVPRHIQEYISRHQLLKKGTDIQVSLKDYPRLIKRYREMGNLGVKSCLFGHFGDAHLHFNFLPTSDEMPIVEKALRELYEEVCTWGASPFAEHGVGLLKQAYVRPYLKDPQIKMYHYLKKTFDPHLQFFPGGPMSLGTRND